MKKAIILVLDSLGLGSSDDASLYGDKGSDTLGHIIEECDLGKANSKKRNGPLKIPNFFLLNKNFSRLLQSNVRFR